MVNQRISSIHQEPDNSLWISGGWGAKGVLRFKDGRLTIYSETDGIMGNDVSCAYKSRNGIMWFGVQGKGAAQYETAALTGFDNKDGLDSTSITPRIQVRSATLLHSSSHAHLFEYDGWLLKA